MVRMQMCQKSGLQVVDAGAESQHSLLIGRRGAANDSGTEVDKVRGPIRDDCRRRPGTHRIGTGRSGPEHDNLRFRPDLSWLGCSFD
jgi:hypothetical protein